MSETEAIGEQKHIETLRVSSEKFMAVLSDDKFTAALAIAAEETKISGRETGFNISIIKNGTTRIPNVVAGSSESIGANREEIAVLDEDFQENEKSGTLFSFHFHPDDNLNVIPSESDLLTFLNDGKGRATFAATMGIGSVDDKGEVAMLLMIPKYGCISRLDIRQYGEVIEGEEIRDIGPQENVQKILDEVGVFTQKVEYTNRRGRYSLKVFPNKSEIPPIKVALGSFLGD